ncbi:proton-dependent oligopeptide transporter, POT family [Fistulifera solaris]|uniref:Proton-dependent oligopeptide transporter, POT family n=1 Tax=Fistulifera solaris TaxID=1519565 RepID=A0A1Z5KJK3_FISSO|nr:proton-dependent oligopeptide transporter, POT family [Fistulifera solaris]|eukprot:GAX26459.1 proton-dependent oligopeptide transporter, POT family [Fistulifera solaris]
MESRHRNSEKRRPLAENEALEQASFLTPVMLSILVTETGERFAYFGFRAVLVLYFNQAVEYDESQSVANYAFVTSLAYFSPIAGAVMADGRWGRYNTILYFGIVYIFGLAILTAASVLHDLSLKRLVSFVGLFFVCLGTGGIKPCVSSFGADQVGHAPNIQDDDDNKDSVGQIELAARAAQVQGFFAYFYFCINLGALTSISTIPLLRAHYGFRAAFFTPLVFMILAMALFVSKRQDYVHHLPEKDGSSLLTTCRYTLWLFRRNIANSYPSLTSRLPFLTPGSLSEYSVLRNSLDDETKTTREDEVIVDDDGSSDLQLEDAAQALHVLPIMMMLPIFWALYDQQSSVWTLQAQRMKLHGLQPEQLNVINPMQIMVFIPFFDKIVYPALRQRHVNIEPLRRMSWGMLLAAASFVISGLVENAIQKATPNSVDVFWQLPQITVLAIAEIFLSVTGLEFAYATSSERLKTFLMGVFLLTTAVGDMFSGVLYSTIFAHLNQAVVLYVCAALMLGNLALYQKVVVWYNRCDVHTLRESSDDIEIQAFKRSAIRETTSSNSHDVQVT